MPFFRYAATDAQGKAVQGTVQATTSDEAMRALAQRGIQVTTWLEPGAKQAIPANPAAAITRTAASSSPTLAPARSTVPASIPAAGTARPDLTPRRTRRGKDKERFFLFTQISSLLHAGVNPHQAFGDMALRMRRPEYREALMKISQGANVGVPISEVLAAYPDLFPSHVAGLVRAGETGGFLPEACQAVAQQAEASHKFRRSLWFVWAVLINLFLVVPFAYLFYRALPRGYELTEQSGASNMGGGLAAMGAAFWEMFKWPVGPAAAIVYVVAYSIYAWLNSRPMTLKRHGLSLGTPVLGKRAKNEGLSLFAWVLSKVAQAGISPHRSWELGMEAVPNLALRDKLAAAGQRIHTGEKLSAAFYETRLFPDEYAPMVATGEMTGDVPGMLQKLSEVSRQEFEVSTTQSKAAAWVMSSVTIAVTMGIIALFIILTLYYALPATVLKGLEPE